MHTHIDIRDLLITSEESLTEIANAIEALGKDSIYSYVEDGELQIQCKDESRILAKGDPRTGEIVLDAPDHHFHFYWDEVEEDWFSKDHEYRLAQVVETLVSGHAGEKVTLNLNG